MTNTEAIVANMRVNSNDDWVVSESKKVGSITKIATPIALTVAPVSLYITALSSFSLCVESIGWPFGLILALIVSIKPYSSSFLYKNVEIQLLCVFS